LGGIDILRECLAKSLGIDPQKALVIRTDVRHTGRGGASIEIAEAFALVGGTSPTTLGALVPASVMTEPP